MSKPLIVVESPTKVKTIQKYVGNQFKVAATVGHIKDLPQKELGIDLENGFKPKYQNISGKEKVISNLKKVAGDATDIYLAPDPDREGEAIAWHTAEILKKKGRRFHRVLFHELTGNAIKAALGNPEELNQKKYEAQQARRILDRLVGYQISPLLWRKVQRGLSAGRVQSVALRIICERERAIQVFQPEEYWSITAHLESTSPPPFAAKLSKKAGKKLAIPNQEASNTILAELKGAQYIVEQIVKKTTKRNPLPPFTTSKLQQDAIRKLHFTAKKTMIIAQQLYEGIELGPGDQVGLITYMRTDSVRIAEEAAQEALDYIRNHHQLGEKYALPKPRFFKNKSKAQDAHEAIRPTAVERTPESVEPYLNKDQAALYRLIWQRFVASQMAQALIDQTTVTINANDYQFSASGSQIKFDGFMKLYLSADEEDQNAEKKTFLPELKEGEALKLNQLEPKQHFTQPPPRFSEASLVKELEENGIGRPSTYATILSTIRDKGYVELIKAYFRPSELGFLVNDLLVDNFDDLFNVNFTAKMEDNLDRVEAAEVDALGILNEFYSPFKNELDAATNNMLSLKGQGVPTGLPCPKCQKGLHIKVGKNGPFLACSGYPECTYSNNYERDDKGRISPVEAPVTEVVDRNCEKCGKPMVKKTGRYGTFLACSGYPECKHTVSVNDSTPKQTTGVVCPKEGCKGEIVVKTSKRGKIFYGCNRYPECDFAAWDKPVNTPCPNCNSPYLLEKDTKKEGTILVCPEKECGYRGKP